LAAEKKLAFMRSFVGHRLETITLSVVTERPDGSWTEALTDNYLKLRLRGRHEPNQWLHAKVLEAADGQLTGTHDPTHRC